MAETHAQGPAAGWAYLLEHSPEQDVRISFGYWLRGAPERREAFLAYCYSRPDLPERVREIQREVEQMPPLLFAEAIPAPEARVAQDRQIRKRVAGTGFAAFLLLAVAMGLVNGYGPVLSRTHETRIGVYQRVVLDDGSIAELNTNSELRVDFTEERRDIFLRRGEAYFDVARDASRPFVVHAGSTIAEALGTSFGVRLHDEQRTSVVVVQGRVAMSAASPPDKLFGLFEPAKATPIGPKSILFAGQQGVNEDGHVTVVNLEALELESLEAWRTGHFLFNNKPLVNVVAELNRYNRRQLRIADPSIATIAFSGGFGVGSLDRFIGVLRKGWDIRASPVPGDEDILELRPGRAR